MTPREALEIIKANPGCTAVLDNDCWHITKPKPDDWMVRPEAAKDEWWETSTLLSSRDVDGCDYGGGLIEVLAIEFSMECEGA